MWMIPPSSNPSLLLLMWLTFSLILIPFTINFVWIISLPMSLKPSLWSSLQREFLFQLPKLVLLSTTSPLSLCLLQNFLASFSLTNSHGIFMLITFAKMCKRTLASSTGHSILHPSTPTARYTLLWFVLSLNMPLPALYLLNFKLTIIGLSSRRGLLAASSCSNGSYHMISFSWNLIYLTPFCRLSLSKTSFCPYAPSFWNYLPRSHLSPFPSKPSNWPSTPNFF